MEKQKKDRRTRRTRDMLGDALIELILEKHYDEITVQNVIDRANVGRATFYAHFRDKEDLFLSDFENLLDGVNQHIQLEQAGKAQIVPIRQLFSHLQDFHHLYRALAMSRKMELMLKTGTEYLSKKIEHKLVSQSVSTSVPPAILAHHIASTLFSLLKWWLENNMPYSPDRMDEIFHELVAPGLQQTFEKGQAVTP